MSNGIRGQIATFLLLIMVAVLIFALVTANLGYVSTTATTVANATDSASLYLGSQLATKAHTLCMSFDNGKSCQTEQCKRTGLLGTFLAIIVAVVAIVLIPYTAGMSAFVVAHGMWGVVAIGAIGGAVGGAVGGGIVQGSLTGAVVGAIQGAAIGAAIGFGVTAFGGGPVAGAHGATIAGSVAGSTESAAGVAVGTGGTLIAGSVAVPLTTTTAVLGVGLAAGSALFNNYMQDKMTSDALGAAAKAISGLPEYEQIREGVLFQALTQTVDDPNKTSGSCYWPNATPVQGDQFDANGNGDTNEQIPCFTYWWDRRIWRLKGSLGEGSAESVSRFLDDLKRYRDQVQAFLYQLERGTDDTEGVECSCQPPPMNRLTDGPALEVWRDLKRRGYQVPFWESGPNKQQLMDWYAQDCHVDTCPPPPNGFDSLDAVRLHYETFLDWANSMIYDPVTLEASGQEGLPDLTEGQWAQSLTNTYQDWIGLLYDGTDASCSNTEDATYYCQIQATLAGDSSHGTQMMGIQKWSDITTGIRDQLPNCTLAYGDYIPKQSVQQPPPPVCDNNPTTTAIYNCTWLDPQNAVTTGVHFRDGAFSDPTDPKNFPGPACKVYADHRSNLLTQITTVQTRVNDLPSSSQTSISKNLATLLPAPLCSEGALDQSSVQITNIKVALDNPPATLKYSFDYAYNCAGITRSCNTSCSSGCPGSSCPSCSCNPLSPGSNCSVTNPGTPGGGCNPSGCTYSCGCCVGTGCGKDGKSCCPSTCLCSGTQWTRTYSRTDTYACSQSGSGQGQEPIAAPDLLIPSPLMPIAEFVAHLNDFQSTVNRLAMPFATVDADTDDEVKPVNDAMGTQIDNTNTFLQQVKAFADSMQAARQSLNVATDGQLPNAAQGVDGKYVWKDSRGEHSVEVSIGAFKTAKLEKHKHGNFLIGKTCLELWDYCEHAGDCPSGRQHSGGDNAWVQITRTDPANQNIGFWKWNPFPGTIRKRTHARYNVTDVGIDSTTR